MYDNERDVLQAYAKAARWWKLAGAQGAALTITMLRLTLDQAHFLPAPSSSWLVSRQHDTVAWG